MENFKVSLGLCPWFTKQLFSSPVAEFEEFERQFKLRLRLIKYGWFHLKVYQMFQDLSRRII